MKLNKIITSVLIVFLLFSITLNVFAINDENDVLSNEVKETTTENAGNETNTSKKSDAENETNTTKKSDAENETNTTKKSDAKNETNITKKNDAKKETDTAKKSDTKNKIEDSDFKIINKEIVSAEDKNIIYEDTIVNGNMFLMNGEKVTIKNCKINGDIISASKEIEIIDSMITGTLYVSAEKVNIKTSEIISVYVVGEKIEISEDTEILRELRGFGANITLNGKVKRDVFLVGENVNIGKNANLLGKVDIKAENNKIEKSANVKNINFEKIETQEISTGETIISYILSKGTGIAIILILAIIILAGMPKFTEVNSTLCLVDFFKAFLTGLLEFIVLVMLAIGLMFTGYGVGYGILLLNLIVLLLFVGKIIFVISFGVRMSCSPEKISKVKAFFNIVLVIVILDIIEMISLAGIVGIIIDMIINIILAFVGIGSMFRVIFTSKNKMKVLAERKLSKKKKKIIEEKIENTVENENALKEEIVENTIEEKLTEKVEKMEENKSLEDDTIKEEIKAEVKEEIKQELDEIKEERKEEKNIIEKDDKKDE